MRRPVPLLLALVLAACGEPAATPSLAPADLADLAKAAKAAKPELRVSAPYLVRGYPAALVVTGATPGARVRFLVSGDVTGPGMCNAKGTACIDLAAPVDQVGKVQIADATGRAKFRGPVPQAFPARVEVQALVASPAGVVASGSEIVPVFDPTDDPDLDGVSMADEIAAGTDPLVNAGGGLPPVVAVALADAGPGEDFHCVVTATDPEGGALATRYSWATFGVVSGDFGVVEGAREATLRNPIPAGDEITCTVNVTDGLNVVTVTSDFARSVDGAPTATDVVLTTTASELSATTAADTLTCRLAGVADPEGDAATVTYAWTVDGVTVHTETVDAGGTSALAGDGVFGRDDTVTCTATPSDGTSDGASHAASVVVANHPAACIAQLSGPDTIGNADSSTCSCVPVDLDGDLVSSTCAWTYVHDTTVVSTDCTLTGAVSPDDSTLECHVTATEVGGGTSEATSPSLRVGTWGGKEDVTFPDPGVTLTPATGVTAIDRDTELSCDFAETATAASGEPLLYYVLWRVNEGYASFTTDPTRTVRELLGDGDGGAGTQIRCEVAALNGGPHDPGLAIWGSNTVVIGAPPDGTIDSLVASPSDSVAPGETFACDLELFADELEYAMIDMYVTATDDPAAGSGAVIADTSLMGWSGALTTGIDAGNAGQWVRCEASTFDFATGASDVAVSDWVQVLAAPPVIESVAMAPGIGSVCDARYCQLVLSDADAEAGGDVTVDVEALVYVDGVLAETLSGTADVLPGGTALSLPMSVGVDGGSTVTCEATVTKPGLDPVTAASAAARVMGTGVSVTSVTLGKTTARVGEPLTCEASTSGQCEGSGAADVRYTWYADGVLLDATGRTLDTTGLDGGQDITCGAAGGDADGGFGAPVTSAAVELLPDRWTLVGTEAGAWAGVSVAVLGDVDGDGLGEVVVGSPDFDGDGRASSGALYLLPGQTGGGTVALADIADGTALGGVLWGDSGGWDAYLTICRVPSFNINVPCAPGHAGFDVQTDSNAPLGDGLGTRLALPGDVTGDGVPDLAVSAPYAFAHGQYLAGRTYVLSGAELSAWPIGAVGAHTTDGAVIDGEQGVWQSNLWSMDGADPAWDGHLAGFGLAAGDFDGDGLGDLAIGAPGTDPEGAGSGRVYVLPMGTGLQSGWLGSLTGAADLTGNGDDLPLMGRLLAGHSDYDELPGFYGADLARAGDFDGDGTDDLLVSKQGITTGRFLVQDAVLGEDLSLVNDPDGARKVSPADFMLRVSSHEINPFNDLVSGKTDLFAIGMGSGDFDGDGLGDVALGFIEKEATTQIEVSVWFGDGEDGGADLDAEGPDTGVGGFVVEGRPFGGGLDGNLHVGGVGDVNGDGLDDLAIAAQQDGRAEGMLYVVYGKADTATVTLADLEAGIGGFVLDDLPGMVWSVAGGDVDGDGLSDILMGMPFATGDGAESGAAQVWFGRAEASGLLQAGTDGADFIMGGWFPERIAGGRGDDRLFGSGGADALLGGAGNDRIVIIDDAPTRIDGGSGTDILAFATTTVDLTGMRGRVRSIETLELINSTVQLSSVEVLQSSDTDNTLTVIGGASSELALVDAGWTFDGVEGGYDRVIRGNAVVLAQQGLGLRVAPTLLTTALSVAEDAATGALASLSAEDIDGDAVTFSIDPADLDGRFTIDAAGALSLAVADLDHETEPYLALPITVTDADGLSTTTTLVITVTDAPEVPVFAQSFVDASVPEGALSNVTVAVVRASDEDAGDTVTYSRVSERHWTGLNSWDDTRYALEVDPSTGRVYVQDGTFLNFEFSSDIDLVVRATDGTGLWTDATVSVQLTDLSVVSASFVLPFLTENRGLFDSDGSLTTSFTTSPLHTIDMSTEVAEGDMAIQSPIDDESYPFTGSFDGTIGVDASLDFSDGYLSAYLPAEVAIELPDGVVPGQPFDIATDWALDESAAVWGETPGIAAELGLDMNSIATSLENPLLPEEVTGALSFVDAAIRVVVEPVEFGGAKYSVAYPDGHDIVSPATTNGGFHAWSYPSHGGVAAGTDTVGKVLGGMVLPNDSAATGYVNDDLVISSYATEEFLRMQLDLPTLLTELGIPNVDFGQWSGDAMVPVGSDGGYAELHYDVWTSDFISVAFVDHMFAVQADDVTATLVLEDGTTFTRSMRDGFQGLVLDGSEDLNADDVVSFTMTFEVTATQYKFWNYDLTIDYHSDLFGGSYEVWLPSFDWRTGTMGDLEQVMDVGFGPMRTTDTFIDIINDSESPSWPLLGFEPIEVKGGLQVAH